MIEGVEMKEGVEPIKFGIGNVEDARIIGLIAFAIFFLTAIRLWTNKESLEPIKAGIDNVKAAGITGLIVFAILHPQAIKWWAHEAGIKILGPSSIEFDASEQAAHASTLSLDEKANLEARLKSSNDQMGKQLDLIEILKTPQASQLVVAGRALIKENEKLINETSNATLSAQKVIIANSELIPTNSKWIILVGSDITLESAKDEEKKASDKGNVKLYKNRGVFRTALVYPNRQEAADALAAAKAGIRNDAYMVSLDKWCPNRSDAKPEFTICSE